MGCRVLFCHLRMMMMMMMDQQEQSDDISVMSPLELLTEAAKEDDGHCQPQFR